MGCLEIVWKFKGCLHWKKVEKNWPNQSDILLFSYLVMDCCSKQHRWSFLQVWWHFKTNNPERILYLDHSSIPLENCPMMLAMDLKSWNLRYWILNILVVPASVVRKLYLWLILTHFHYGPTNLHSCFAVYLMYSYCIWLCCMLNQVLDFLFRHPSYVCGRDPNQGQKIVTAITNGQNSQLSCRTKPLLMDMLSFLFILLILAQTGYGLQCLGWQDLTNHCLWAHLAPYRAIPGNWYVLQPCRKPVFIFYPSKYKLANVAHLQKCHIRDLKGCFLLTCIYPIPGIFKSLCTCSAQLTPELRTKKIAVDYLLL